MLLTALSALTKPRNPMDDPAGARTPARQRATRSPKSCAATSTRVRRPSKAGTTPPVPPCERRRPCPQRGGSRMGGLGRRSDLFGDKDIARMPHLGSLSIATARRLACDCHLTPIVMDDGVAPESGENEPHRVEEATPGTRCPRSRCAFPGCGTPPAPLRRPSRKAWADVDPPTSTTSPYSAATTPATASLPWEVHIGPDRRPWFTPPSTVDPYRNPSPPTTARDHTRPDRDNGTHCRPKPLKPAPCKRVPATGEGKSG